MAVFFALPGNEQLATELAERTRGRVGDLVVRRFPDGESYVRVGSEVAGDDAFVVCTLARPDPQFLALAFTAATLRRADARTVGLVAPYLAYMRQDAVFRSGEAVSAVDFAGLLQRYFDSVVTVDPHLHRIESLQEIYRIPTTVVHTANTIGAWVRENVDLPVVIGPDEESAQWVEEVALKADCPWTVFLKERRGDQNVTVFAPDLRCLLERTPVLIDDIVSSGATMVEAAKTLTSAGFRRGICVAVHALFDDGVSVQLCSLFKQLVTSDSVPNRFSRFHVAPLIAARLA